MPSSVVIALSVFACMAFLGLLIGAAYYLKRALWQPRSLEQRQKFWDSLVDALRLQFLPLPLRALLALAFCITIFASVLSHFAEDPRVRERVARMIDPEPLSGPRHRRPRANPAQTTRAQELVDSPVIVNVSAEVDADADFQSTSSVPATPAQRLAAQAVPTSVPQMAGGSAPPLSPAGGFKAPPKPRPIPTIAVPTLNLKAPLVGQTPSSNAAAVSEVQQKTSRMVSSTPQSYQQGLATAQPLWATPVPRKPRLDKLYGLPTADYAQPRAATPARSSTPKSALSALASLSPYEAEPKPTGKPPASTPKSANVQARSTLLASTRPQAARPPSLGADTPAFRDSSGRIKYYTSLYTEPQTTPTPGHRIVLHNGETLLGTLLDRQGSYTIRMANGAIIRLPLEKVLEVRPSG